MQDLLSATKPLAAAFFVACLGLLAYRLYAKAMRERAAYITRSLKEKLGKATCITTVDGKVFELPYLRVISRGHTHIGCWVPVSTINLRESGPTLMLFNNGSKDWSKVTTALVLYNLAEQVWQVAIYGDQPIESVEGDITVHEVPVTLIGPFGAVA